MLKSIFQDLDKCDRTKYHVQIKNLKSCQIYFSFLFPGSHSADISACVWRACVISSFSQPYLVFSHIHILVLSSLSFAPSEALEPLKARDVTQQGPAEVPPLLLCVGYFPGESCRSLCSRFQGVLCSAWSQGDIVSWMMQLKIPFPVLLLSWSVFPLFSKTSQQLHIFRSCSFFPTNLCEDKLCPQLL